MEVKLITLFFDPGRADFNREELEDFCLNKQIHQVEGHFFEHQGCPYWTFLLKYELVLDPETKLPPLDPEAMKLMLLLKAWRREKAGEVGYPPYLICTNKQFVEMIKHKVQSINGFDQVKGFGKKRREKYGQEIIALIQKFYQA